MKKRIIAIMLAAMVLITACGNGGTEQGDNGETGDTPPVVDNQGAPDEIVIELPEQNPDLSYSGFNPLDYGMQPFDSQVVLQIPVFDRVEEGSPDPADNHYTRWVQEHFGDNMNIKVEYIPIIRADTMMSYNLLFAGGTPPTILMEYDWDKVCQWAGDGALAVIDLQEFAQYAPTWFEKVGGKERFDTYKVNNEYVFAPGHRPNVIDGISFVIFYRKDWYRQAGLELPGSWEEYAHAMKTFFDMGLTDGQPIIPQAGFSGNYQIGGHYAFPRDEEEWVMHTGVTVAALPTEAAYWDLKRLNHLYNEGLISREFELLGAADNYARFINGTAYSLGSYIWDAGNALEAFFENFPDAELGVIDNYSVWWHDDPTPNWGINDVPHGEIAQPVGWYIGFSARASADEIKAAYMYLEWMNQEDVLDYMQFGPGEGITYDVGADGVRQLYNMADMPEEFRMLHNNRNKDYWSVSTEGYDLPSEEKVIQDTAHMAGLPQSFTEELLDMVRLNRAKYEDGLRYPGPIFSREIMSINEYAGSLDPLFAEFATRLVKCDPDEFDALYERFKQEYLDAGYAAIMAERLQQYHDGYTNKLPPQAKGEEPFVRRTDWLDVVQGDWLINP